MNRILLSAFLTMLAGGCAELSTAPKNSLIPAATAVNGALTPKATRVPTLDGMPLAGPLNSDCQVYLYSNGYAAINCPGLVHATQTSGPDAFQKQLLDLINGSRAGGGLPPYTFSSVQSAGTASCVGSLGHSMHMAQAGQISHDQFPQDICIPWSSAGENVGEASGSESNAIQIIHQSMIGEGPSGGHYQNIMSTTFTTIGIGLYYINGTLWLTEDFV